MVDFIGVSSVSSDVSAGAAGGSQGDRGGLGSVLRDLVKPGDENLREMNKKLQNMLEEQLTKNMHLQKVTHTHRGLQVTSAPGDIVWMLSHSDGLYVRLKCFITHPGLRF